MALLNLPPLAESEKILRSRFRATGDPANTFLQAGFVWVPPGFLVPPGFGSPIPRLESSGFAAGASCWVWEQVVGFGRLEICWSRHRALSDEPGLASRLHLELELGR